MWPTLPQAPHFNFKSGFSLTFLFDLAGDWGRILLHDEFATAVDEDA